MKWLVNWNLLRIRIRSKNTQPHLSNIHDRTTRNCLQKRQGPLRFFFRGSACSSKLSLPRKIIKLNKFFVVFWKESKRRKLIGFVANPQLSCSISRWIVQIGKNSLTVVVAVSCTLLPQLSVRKKKKSRSARLWKTFAILKEVRMSESKFGVLSCGLKSIHSHLEEEFSLKTVLVLAKLLTLPGI